MTETWRRVPIFIAVLGLLISVPLTVWVAVRERSDIRSRAQVSPPPPTSALSYLPITEIGVISRQDGPLVSPAPIPIIGDQICGGPGRLICPPDNSCVYSGGTTVDTSGTAYGRCLPPPTAPPFYYLSTSDGRRYPLEAVPTLMPICLPGQVCPRYPTTVVNLDQFVGQTVLTEGEMQFSSWSGYWPLPTDLLYLVRKVSLAQRYAGPLVVTGLLTPDKTGVYPSENVFNVDNQTLQPFCATLSPPCGAWPYLPPVRYVRSSFIDLNRFLGASFKAFGDLYMVGGQKDVFFSASSAQSVSTAQTEIYFDPPTEVFQVPSPQGTASAFMNTGSNQVIGADIYLRFDPNKLEITGMVPAGPLGRILAGPVIDLTNGLARVALGTTGGAVSGNRLPIVKVAWRMKPGVYGTTQIGLDPSTRINLLGLPANGLHSTGFYTITSTVSPVVGDLNGDGRVDLTDLTMLLGNFAAVPIPPPPGQLRPTMLPVGDLDHNGIVNGQDYNLLVTNYGKGAVGWNTGCRVDSDCKLVDSQTAGSCCGFGCGVIDYSQDRWVAVNAGWYDAQHAAVCTASEMKACPLLTCPVGWVESNNNYSARCLVGGCTKVNSSVLPLQ